MNIASFARGLFAIGTVLASSAALAQQPMAEIIGQPVQVTTNGVTNTLYFNADGTLRILTPNSNVVPANWALSQGNLCLSMSGGQECVPYNSAFQAQQPQTFTSSCNSVSTWVAQATNNPSQQLRGERGN